MNEIRLIDANALKEKFNKLECYTNNFKLNAIIELLLHEFVTQIIDEAPTYDIIDDCE